ncbi:hypothetical protein CBL_09750 [Carabus blaptoides fortunei]
METDCSFIDYTFINFGNSESLLTTSQYAKVIFHNIEEKYNFDKDLVCQYSLTDQFSANPGDRIVLFRLGWQQVTDYVLFEWAPVPQDDSALQIKFAANSLPRDTNEFYQLCYLSGENAVCGASIPFQFTNANGTMLTSTYAECFESLQMNLSKTTSGFGSQRSSLVVDSLTVKETSPAVTYSNNLIADVAQVKEENKQLKRDLLQTTTSLQRCDSQMKDLQSEVDSLKSVLQVTQNDVADLKLRMDMANDEYRKLYAEKTRTERKYEKLVTKCQVRVSQKKTMDSTSDTSCDFIGELEPLPPFPLLL